MAQENEILGINGKIDISDIEKGFDNIFKLLDKLGVKTEEVQNKTRKSLEEVANSTEGFAEKQRKVSEILAQGLNFAKEKLGEYEAELKKVSQQIDEAEAKKKKADSAPISYGKNGEFLPNAEAEKAEKELALLNNQYMQVLRTVENLRNGITDLSIAEQNHAEASKKANEEAKASQKAQSDTSETIKVQETEVSKLTATLEELKKKKEEILRIGESEWFFPEVPADMLANSGNTFGSETLEALREVNAKIKETEQQLAAAKEQTVEFSNSLPQEEETESLSSLEAKVKSLTEELRTMEEQKEKLASKKSVNDDEKRAYAELVESIKGANKELEEYDKKLHEARGETFVGSIRNAFESINEAVVRGKDVVTGYFDNIKAKAREAIGNNSFTRRVSEEYSQLSLAVSGATGKVKDFLTGHGKFQQSMSSIGDAFGALGLPIKNVTSFLGQFNAALLRIAFTPLGAAIAVVLVALKSLNSYFQKSAEGQERYAQITAYLGSLFESFSDIMIKFGEYLYKAFADSQGPMNAFAKGLINTVGGAIRTVSDLLGGLGTSLGGIWKMMQGDFSGGWEQLRNGISSVGSGLKEGWETIKSAAGTAVDFGKGIWSMAKDGVAELQGTNLETSVDGMLAKAQRAAELAKQSTQNTIEQNEAKVHAAELDKRIAENREKIYTLTGKEKDALIEETKQLERQKYEGWTDEEGKRHKGLLETQRAELEILEEKHKLHTNSLEDYQKERDLRAQILNTEKEQAASTRALTRMQQSNLRSIETSEASDAKKNAKQKEDEAKAQAKLNELLYTSELQRIQVEETLESQIAEAKIKAMREGFVKTQAERKRQSEEELRSVETQRKAALEEERKKQKAQFDAEQEIIKAGGGTPVQWENSMFNENDEAVQRINKLYEDLKTAVFSTQVAAEIAAGEELIAQHQSYIDRKIALDKQYADDVAEIDAAIKEAQERGDNDMADALARSKQQAAKDYAKSSSELATEELKETLNFADFFGSNMDRQTLSMLESMRKKLAEYIETQKDLDPENVRELQEALEELDKEIRTREPFSKLGEDIKNYKDAQHDVKEAEQLLKEVRKEGGSATRMELDENNRLIPVLYTEEQAEKKLAKAQEERRKAQVDLGNSIAALGGKMSQWSSAVSDIANTMENDLGVHLGDGLNQAIEGFSQLSDGVSSFGQSLLTGNVAGAIAGVVKSVGAVVKMGEGVGKALGFGSDWSSYNRMLEEYQKLNAIWDEVISKKREYLSISYGEEALRVGEETMNIAQQAVESSRTLGRELLNSGASVGSHSIGVRQRENMSNEAWAQLRNASRSMGFDYNAVAEGRMLGLFDLSAKQLQGIQEQAPIFWAKLDEGVRGYLEAIIEGEERITSIQDQLKEQVAATSSTSVSDGFFDMLSDMESGTERFADNVSELMFNAFVNGKLKSKYEKQLKDWYESFYAASKDGLTSEEIADLRKRYKEISEAALEERDAIAKLTGYQEQGEEGNPDQQATYNSLEKWTYDQADELISRATAMQIIGEHVYERMGGMIELQAVVQSDVSIIRSDVGGIRLNVEKLVEMQRDNGDRLERIVVNTNPISEIRDIVKKIYNER